MSSDKDFSELEKRLEAPGKRAVSAFFTRTSWQFRQLIYPAGKRLIDILAGFIMLTLLLPAIFLFSIIQGNSGRIFARNSRLGRWGEPFEELTFAPTNSFLAGIVEKTGMSRLATAINLLRGDISLIGPRAMTLEEAAGIPVQMLRRLDIKPGLICLWWIRQRGNVGFDGEFAADREYIERQGLKTDAAIILKALPASVFGDSGSEFSADVEILDIPLKNLTMSEALDSIVSMFSEKQRQQICFINADCANLAWNDAGYMSILHKTTMNLADGIGLKIAGRMTGRQIRQNVNGTDLFPRLASVMAEKRRSIFFLGARPEVNQALIETMREKFPGLVIAGGQHGYFKPEEENEIIERINRLNPDLLLVAFGAPRQEKWIAANLDRLKVKVAMGVGGLFDFYSGRINRAPIWMREIGMEWFYRFWQEPQRMWKRYFVGNLVFLYRVVRSKAGTRAPSLEPAAGE
ncbi:MAG: WecB/TagA/CpsF family glycosyltransferase [Candidatus Rifleibacteriota bacterium]